MWRSFFEGIGDLFSFIMIPRNWLADLELSNWWIANAVNWIFVIICTLAFVYWMKQLRIVQQNNDDDQDTTAHSYLK